MSLWDLRKGRPSFTFAPKDADKKGDTGGVLASVHSRSFYLHAKESLQSMGGTSDVSCLHR